MVLCPEVTVLRNTLKGQEIAKRTIRLLFAHCLYSDANMMKKGFLQVFLLYLTMLVSGVDHIGQRDICNPSPLSPNRQST